MSAAELFASLAGLLLLGQMAFFMAKRLSLGKVLIPVGRRRYGTAGFLVALAIFYVGFLWSDQSGKTIIRRPSLHFSGSQAWVFYICLTALVCLWVSGIVRALRRAIIRENGIMVSANRMWRWDEIVNYEWDGDDLLLFVETGGPFLRRVAQKVLAVAPEEKARVVEILGDKIPGKETMAPASG